MQSADIKTGEQYKVEYGVCATVLETRLPLKSWTGTMRKAGVRVRFVGGSRDGKEKIIPSREIYEPWADYKQREEDRKLRRKIAIQDRERTTKIVNQLKEAIEERGIEVRDACSGYGYRGRDQTHYGNISLDDQEMHKLIALLSAPECGTVIEEPQPSPLSELID